MSMDYPAYCPHCKANVEGCEEHHAGRAPSPGFGPGVCPVVQERNAALAVVRAVYQESKAIHSEYKKLPEALRAEIEGKPAPKTGGALHCREHGGYGFSADCIECRDFEARR